MNRYVDTYGTRGIEVKRGEHYIHPHWLDARDNSPAIIEVTHTKRYTARDGVDSTLVYYRAIYRWADRTTYGAKYMVDIRDTRDWQAANAWAEAAEQNA